jgi:hypothetical protein
MTQPLVHERPRQDAITGHQGLAELAEDLCDRSHDPHGVGNWLGRLVDFPIQP